jgi:hypothetical protein
MGLAVSVAMLDALPPRICATLRDRTILLVGFPGGLRRSEIVGLLMSRVGLAGVLRRRRTKPATIFVRRR